MLAEKPSVRIDGERAVIDFNRFDLDNYGLFLKVKQLPESQLTYDWRSDTYTVTTPARFAPRLGVAAEIVEQARLPLPSHLFDYQSWIIKRALDAKRFAIWADTGLGKGPMILEWCRQVVHVTGGRVLIIEPLQIIEQLRQEAARFYGENVTIEGIGTRERLEAWCKEPGSAIGIVNPEKFIPGILPELRYLAGVALDESSILKSGGGVIKWNLIHSAKGIEYKLSATATPAPNDTMEFASQASFLEKLRTEGEILWTYFTRDKYDNWQVKPHARAAFYQFLSSWSIYLRNPARLGFGDILASLPPPDIREYKLDITSVQRELMYGFLVKGGKGLWSDDRLGVQERSKLSQLAKGFLYERGEKARRAVRIESRKPAYVAEIIRADVADKRQVLVWTVFDEESEIIAEQLRGEPFIVETLDGSMGMDDRMARIEAFKKGRVQVLISKAQLLGYGLNFQNCRSMVFSGFDDSFERFYQAIRRAYRFGQKETVRVHVPYIPELEGMIFENIQAKQARFDEDTAQMEREYREALRLTG